MPADNSEVLRGMHVEVAPFHLRRAKQVSPKERGAPDMSPQEAATRQGYEAGLQRGHAEGFRRGHEEGCLAARQECRLEAEAALQKAIAEATAPLLEREGKFRALVASIEGEERSRLLAAEDEMVALCYETVCAVLGARAVRPAIVRAHLASIRAQTREGGGLALHVHPEDAALMASTCPLGGAQETPALGWVADPEITMGGCKVVQRGGGLDLRLDTALERCKELLLQARSRRRAVARENP